MATTITIDTPPTQSIKTHFSTIEEMYEYLSTLYTESDTVEKDDDIVEYKWKKVSRYVKSIMEDDDEDGPFTIEESKAFLEKVVSWK